VWFASNSGGLCGLSFCVAIRHGIGYGVPESAPVVEILSRQQSSLSQDGPIGLVVVVVVVTREVEKVIRETPSDLVHTPLPCKVCGERDRLYWRPQVSSTRYSTVDALLRGVQYMQFLN
jgi:hypothetical protein